MCTQILLKSRQKQQRLRNLGEKLEQNMSYYSRYVRNSILYPTYHFFWAKNAIHIFLTFTLAMICN